MIQPLQLKEKFSVPPRGGDKGAAWRNGVQPSEIAFVIILSLLLSVFFLFLNAKKEVSRVQEQIEILFLVADGATVADILPEIRIDDYLDLASVCRFDGSSASYNSIFPQVINGCSTLYPDMAVSVGSADVGYEEGGFIQSGYGQKNSPLVRLSLNIRFSLILMIVFLSLGAYLFSIYITFKVKLFLIDFRKMESSKAARYVIDEIYDYGHKVANNDLNDNCLSVSDCELTPKFDSVRELLNRILDGCDKRIQTIARKLTVEKEVSGSYQVALLQECDQVFDLSCRLKERGAFISDLSHEIRNCLNGILGVADFLIQQEDFFSGNRKSLEALKTASVTLKSLVDDILEIEKVDSGVLVLKSESFFLFDAIVNTVKLFESMAKHKGLTLNTKNKGDIPCMLVGDRRRVCQVVSNLLLNAIKFTESGEINVTTTVERIDDGNCSFSVSIQDTGVGISSGNLQNLFDRYFRVEEIDVEKIEGTGLGLSISRKIVAKMGGGIVAKSVLGEGSEFVVSLSLPLGCTHKQTESILQPVDKKCSSIDANFEESEPPVSVLVVEDEELNRQVVSIMLEAGNYQMEFAENGLEAIEKAISIEYDCILMDCNLPEMDGYTATQKIRGGQTYCASKDKPIIAITANVSEAQRLKCKESGMNDFLAKPFTYTELISTLEKWTSHLGCDDVGRTSEFNADKVGSDECIQKASGDKPDPEWNEQEDEFFTKSLISESTLDLEVLKSIVDLENMTGKELLPRMIKRYFSEAPQMLEKIISKSTEEEWDEVRKEAHRLKSMSANLGMKEIASICEFIEHEDNLDENSTQIRLDAVLGLINDYQLTFSESNRSKLMRCLMTI